MTKTTKIINLLFQVDKAIHEQLRDADKKCPVSLPEFMALGYLDREGPASISDMAAHFGVRKSSVSIKVAKLEKQGLVVRSMSEADRRSHTLELTDAARDMLEQSKSYVAEHASPLFDQLDTKEKELFIQLLTKIITQ